MCNASSDAFPRSTDQFSKGERWTKMSESLETVWGYPWRSLWDAWFIFFWCFVFNNFCVNIFLDNTLRMFGTYTNNWSFSAYLYFTAETNDWLYCFRQSIAGANGQPKQIALGRQSHAHFEGHTVAARVRIPRFLACFLRSKYRAIRSRHHTADKIALCMLIFPEPFRLIKPTKLLGN
jgi:hypothetical protein